MRRRHPPGREEGDCAEMTTREPDPRSDLGPDLGLEGQLLVYKAWRRLSARGEPVRRADLDLSTIIGELAHVSVLRRETDGFRFRLAGSEIRRLFDCEARGRRIEDIGMCVGEAWVDASLVALVDGRPGAGRCEAQSGVTHFWLRLPVSSDGVKLDEVLCHDRLVAGADLAGAPGAGDRAQGRDRRAA